MTIGSFIRACFSGLALVLVCVVGCWMLTAVGEFLRGER
jgi:hypothetical protein